MHIKPPALVCLFYKIAIIKKKEVGDYEIQGKKMWDFLKNKVK